MLMTKSNRRVFRDQRDVTLINDLIWHFFELVRDSLSMFNLSESFRNIQSNLKELRWWHSQTEAFFLSQGDVTLTVVIRSNRDFISVDFRNFQTNLNELWWWQTFSHCKARGHCGKLMPSMSHHRHAIDEKWLRTAYRLWRYNWSEVLTDDGRTTGGRTTDEGWPTSQ